MPMMVSFWDFAFGWIGAIPCALATALLWPVLVVLILGWVMVILLGSFWKDIEKLAMFAAVFAGIGMGAAAVRAIG